MDTKKLSRYLLSLVFSLVAYVLSCAPSNAQCTDFSDGLSINYTGTDKINVDLLQNINGHHFNANVEQLIKGQTGRLEDDLDYLLRNVPNHHRGLYAMAQLHLRENTEKLKLESYSMPCWFERAIAFSPNDPVVRMVNGIYLHRRKEYAAAEKRYLEAISLEPRLVEAHYNIALLYIDMSRFDDAVTHARRAYELGYPLPGLKQKLASSGHWVDPAKPPPSSH